MIASQAPENLEKMNLNHFRQLLTKTYEINLQSRKKKNGYSVVVQSRIILYGIEWSIWRTIYILMRSLFTRI